MTLRTVSRSYKSVQDQIRRMEVDKACVWASRWCQSLTPACWPPPSSPCCCCCCCCCCLLLLLPLGCNIITSDNIHCSAAELYLFIYGCCCCWCVCVGLSCSLLDGYQLRLLRSLKKVYYNKLDPNNYRGILYKCNELYCKIILLWHAWYYPTDFSYHAVTGSYGLSVNRLLDGWMDGAAHSVTTTVVGVPIDR